VSSYCLTCGAEVEEYDSGYYARSMLCIPCYERKEEQLEMVACARCGTRVRREEARLRKGERFCSYCASEIDRSERPLCPVCRKTIESWQKSVRLANNNVVHEECALERREGKRSVAFCSFCGQETDFYKSLPDGKAICAKCDSHGAQYSRNETLLSRLVDRIGSMIG